MFKIAIKYNFKLLFKLPCLLLPTTYFIVANFEFFSAEFDLKMYLPYLKQQASKQTCLVSAPATLQSLLLL